MQIFVNGDAREITETTTAADLLAQLELTGERLAMEVNLEIVPRGNFETHQFCAGDKIEIVRAIGGG